MNLETYISEFSKYVIAVLAVLYTFDTFLSLFCKNDQKSRGCFALQNILMFAFHFSGFMVICFETENVSFLIFYVFQQIILYIAIMLYKSLYPNSSRLIVNNLCMLLSISFIILTRLDYSKAVKQFIIASASLVIALIIPFFIKQFSFLKKMKWIYAFLGIGLLGIMMILGQTTYGSKISYSIAGISFQPAEVVKLLFVFFVASALYKSTSFIQVALASLVAAIHVCIQVLNKDLGSALIFFVVYICMLFISSHNVLYMLLGFLAAGGASYLAYGAFSHIRVRFLAWSDPWSVIDSSGYQITQSLFAISSGGLFGLGLYKGSPGSIPFVEDDFIFSAIAEEMGIIFAVCLILICLFTFIKIMIIALKLEDKFYQLLAIGLGITYIFQVFLTIGGGSKFIPLTGVTLPLVSYGGSSILCSVIMFAIIEGLSIISCGSSTLENVRDNESIKKRPIKDDNRSKNNTYKKSEVKRSLKDNRNNCNNHYSKNREDEYEDEYDEDYEADYEEDYEEAEYDEDYEEEGYFSDYDEDEDEDEDIDFLRGFTKPIDNRIVNSIIEGDEEEFEIEFDDIGEIYYNEEEYEKDKFREKRQKENQ